MVQNELLEMNNVGVIVEEKRYNRRKSRVELAKSKCGGLCKTNVVHQMGKWAKLEGCNMYFTL